MGNAWAHGAPVDERPSRGPGWNGRIRRFSRRILNPLMLRVANRVHGTYPAIVRHVGRRTGRAYRTPIVAQPIDGGFIIPLPYGADTDWRLNARAAGHFTIERAGKTYEVGDLPLIDSAAALPLVPEGIRRTWRRLRIAAFLRVRTLPPSPPSTPRSN